MQSKTPGERTSPGVFFYPQCLSRRRPPGHPPGMHHRFNQRGQRNGEEDAPEPPQTAKDHHRQDNHQRVQIHQAREQHRDQQIAVKPLNNQIDREQTPEPGARAKLKQRHPHHRNGHHKCTNIGDQHREAHQHRQQQE